MNKDVKIILFMFLIFISVFSIVVTIFYFTDKMRTVQPNMDPQVANIWEVRSIDTMKYSRDVAKAKLDDPSFDTVIDQQVKDIAATGANYVAIGTPYDEEFVPILKRWVKAARKYNLHVWYRGNFSGWEGWFNYPKIDMLTHISSTKEFIMNNEDLFEDGDIFTSCPECENGAQLQWGNPKSLEEHRAFLIAEYDVSKAAFALIGKDVKTGYFSMNGDLARLMMDKPTTQQLGGVVVVDHYVSTPETLAADVKDMAVRSGGQVMLGEFGAPIPDIHGEMTQEEQSTWVFDALSLLADTPELIGLNYWVNIGGSTSIWENDGTPKKAVEAVTKFYSSTPVELLVE